MSLLLCFQFFGARPQLINDVVSHTLLYNITVIQVLNFMNIIGACGFKY